MNNNEITHSKKNMASYGFAKALVEFISFAFTAFGFYYYETELGLDVLLVGLGYVIFAIYNAINDPLVGYLTNKPLYYQFFSGTLKCVSPSPPVVIHMQLFYSITELILGLY